MKQKITAWEPLDFFLVGTDFYAIVKFRQVKDEFASCFGHLPNVLRNVTSQFGRSDYIPSIVLFCLLFHDVYIC